MIEALACGTPVLAWRCGSVPEVIIDGVTGFVVDSLDQAVQAVDRIAGPSRHACRTAFEERFDMTRMARDYLEVYRRLVHDGLDLMAQGLARYGLGSRRYKFGPGCSRPGGTSTCTGCQSCSAASRRTRERGRSSHPVACAPQAWAAASVFLLFQACLGLEINAPEGQVYFTRPHLPASLDELRIHNLEVAGATVDLLLVRHEHDVSVNVLRREGDVEILVVK